MQGSTLNDSTLIGEAKAIIVNVLLWYGRRSPRARALTERVASRLRRYHWFREG